MAMPTTEFSSGIAPRRDTTAAGALPVSVRRLGRADYGEVWSRMQSFTEQRTAATGDELWLVEHPPVYTLGRNGRPEHVLNPGTIPVVRTDRGGQVTYHGPGQLVVYCLLNLTRRGMGVRGLVTLLEGAVIDVLADHGIDAAGRRDAPGVYVNGSKIAAVGLRIRRGCSYHGLSLNVDMDLAPFSGINPCGHAGMGVTQLRDQGAPISLQAAADQVTARLLDRLGGDQRGLTP